MPLPNQPGANNFFRTADLTDNQDRFIGRGDWKPGASDSVFGRYIYSNRQRDIPGAFGGVVDGTGTSAFGNQTIKTNAFVGGWTRVISSTMVNEARISWSQATSDAVQQPYGLFPPAAATIPGSVTDPIVAGGLPGITIDGFFGGSGLGRIGSPDFLPKFQHTNQVEYLDTLSWLRGNHTLKGGADIIAPMQNHYMDVPATRGSLRFRNAFTGNPMADYLLGYVSDLQLSNVWTVEQRHWASMFFVQDDWKASSKLTVNLGLRYDFITPALEAGEPPDELRPGRRRLARIRERRVTRRARARAAGPQQLGAADQRGLQAHRPHHPARRLGHLLQPLRSRRQRGPARAERARPREQQHHADLRRAGVLPAERVAGELPQRARPEPGQRRAEAAARPRGLERRAEDDDQPVERGHPARDHATA